MARDEAPTGWRLVARLAAVVLVVAALYFARGLFIPFALAALLSFLLAPIVNAIERLHVTRTIAAVVTVLLASSGIFALGWAVYAQLTDLGSSLPGYQENIRRKIAPLRGESVVEKIEKQIAEAVEEKPAESGAKPTGAEPPPEGRPTPRKAAPERPMRVTVVPGVPTPFQFLGGVLGPLLEPVGTFGIVFVLVLFLLVYQQDFRNRFIRMVSPDRIAATTNALAEASHRTSRYLLMTLIVNATYGIPVGIGLAILGLPNALLWGLFATLLRFIPYLGPWIAAAFPIALSIAVSPGWTLTAWVVGLFVVLELVSNNLIEPLLYGKQTGLSPLAVIAAAVFWTWLWDVPGLFLSVPLTLCLVVMGRHIPQLGFLSVLLGDEPSLRPGERFYQRLVALDADEATRIIEEHLRDHGLVALYDDVLLPALAVARRDTVQGNLGPQAVQYVRDTTREVLEELSEEEHPLEVPLVPKPGESADAPAAALPAEVTSVSAVPGLRIGFLPAGDETDALTGPILADVLRRLGFGFDLFAGNASAGELREWIGRSGARVVCIGGFAPHAVVRARHLYKRLRSAVPDVRVLVTIWGIESERPDSLERLKVVRPDRIATTMAQALDAIRALAAEVAVHPGSAPETAAKPRSKGPKPLSDEA